MKKMYIVIENVISANFELLCNILGVYSTYEDAYTEMMLSHYTIADLHNDTKLFEECDNMCSICQYKVNDTIVKHIVTIKEYVE